MNLFVLHGVDDREGMTAVVRAESPEHARDIASEAALSKSGGVDWANARCEELTREGAARLIVSDDPDLEGSDRAASPTKGQYYSIQALSAAGETVTFPAVWGLSGNEAVVFLRQLHQENEEKFSAYEATGDGPQPRWFTVCYSADGVVGNTAVHALSSDQAVALVRRSHQQSAAWNPTLHAHGYSYQIIAESDQKPALPTLSVPERIAAEMGDREMSSGQVLVALMTNGMDLRSGNPRGYVATLLNSARVIAKDSGVQVRMFTTVQRAVYRVSTREDIREDIRRQHVV